MGVIKKIKKQYQIAGGYAEFLRVAIPLIISTGVSTTQVFINRIFLSYYSQISYAASVPASLSSLSVISVFLFTLAYVDIFVAQYYGKKEYRSIGPSIWQSVYLAMAAAFVIFLVSLFSEKIFTNIGHSCEIAYEEAKYFRMLCYSAFPTIASLALSGFYSGRGKTKTVLLVTICSVTVNIVLDFCLIFGKFGFPEAGITGAALATCISSTISVLIFMILILRKKNNAIYNTRNFRPDFAFMKRLLRYGFPNGISVFFDIIGFSIFMIMIGTIGATELIASNMISSIYQVIVIPICGSGIAISIMVGQYLGKNKAFIAKISVRSSFHVLYVYVTILTLLLIFVPKLFIYPFTLGSQALSLDTVSPVSLNLLKILVVYLLVEPCVIFGHAIKGAGDTAYVMKNIVFASICLLIIPVYFLVVVFKSGVYVAWVFLLLYAMFPSGAYYLRYKRGKWERKGVIVTKEGY